MNAKEPRIKLRRLLLLFGIVIGCITALGIVAALVVAEWPLVTAIAWHIRNGRTVSLEGHTFNVPLLYEPEVSNGGTKIDIVEYPRMMGGIGSVTVESTAKILDEASIARWQSSLLQALNKHSNSSERNIPITLHGKKLTYICVDWISPYQDSLICHAVGSDIAASTMASPERANQTRSILENSY